MPKRLVPNSDERTNLTPEERRQARERSYRLLREILRPHRLSLATWGDRIRRAALVDCARARYRD